MHQNVHQIALLHVSFTQRTNRMMHTLAVAAAVLASASAFNVPSVPLGNAAVPGLTMPAIGLGTGAYNSNPDVGYGGYPECWSSNGGCGAFVQVGGRRIDNANSYQNVKDVGIAIAQSGVARSDIFLLSKVGPGNPLGYNDTLVQFQGILDDMQTPYVDILLVHWPWDSKPQGNVTSNSTVSTDPYCNHTSPVYSETQCRLNTWKAMVEIFNSGRAKAIGVSNYNVTHFQEIINAGMPLPALTQNPFHLYRSSTQMDVLSFTARHGITFLGYSPFGVPDYHKYPAPLPVPNQLQHPDVLSISQKYSVTPAQVLIQWQWQLGIPVNPRSMSQQHMTDNLNTYGLFSLNQTEMDTLSSQPQVSCAIDPTWYECDY